MLEQVTLKEDYSDKLSFLHYVAIGGEIIWPESRKGQTVQTEETQTKTN